MRAREWSYILVDLPLIVPPTMLVGTDARRVWIIAHFTQVAVEVEGAVLDTADVGTDAEDEDHDHGAYLLLGPSPRVAPSTLVLLLRASAAHPACPCVARWHGRV